MMINQEKTQDSIISNNGDAGKKYGLFTSLSLVIGIVIGSGIFFKSEEIASAVGSHIYLGVLAWVLGGFITMTMAYSFAILAGEIDQPGGVIGYAEIICNKKYGQVFGWFLTTLYFPFTSAILAWVAADFSFKLIGIEANFLYLTLLSAIYIISIYILNYASAKLAGKFAVSTVIIKLIPIILVGVVGIVLGLVNGTTLDNINSGFEGTSGKVSFLAAIVATTFAFGGWLDGATISADVKNPRKNLPIAMTGGVFIIVVLYVLYYLGMFGSISIEDLAGGGTLAALANIFGTFAGPILFAFIIISCLGACNGLIMAGSRTMHVVAPKKVSPKNSTIFSLIFTITCLLIWGASIYLSWGMNLSNIIIIIFNVLLCPILIGMMFKLKSKNSFNRFIMPSLATLGALFLFVAMILTEFGII